MESKSFGETPIEAEKPKNDPSFPKKAGIAAAAFLAAGISAEASPAYSQEQPQDTSQIEKADMAKISEQRAIDFLDKLFNLPNNPRATNPAENKIMQERTAEVLIQAYALQLKNESSGNVSPEDIKNALKDLRSGLVAYGEKKFGGVNEMAGAFKNNPGYKVLEKKLLREQQL